MAVSVVWSFLLQVKRTALHKAARVGNNHVITYLISIGARVDAINSVSLHNNITTGMKIAWRLCSSFINCYFAYIAHFERIAVSNENTSENYCLSHSGLKIPWKYSVKLSKDKKIRTIVAFIYRQLRDLSNLLWLINITRFIRLPTYSWFTLVKSCDLLYHMIYKFYWFLNDYCTRKHIRFHKNGNIL